MSLLDDFKLGSGKSTSSPPRPHNFSGHDHQNHKRSQLRVIFVFHRCRSMGRMPDLVLTADASGNRPSKPKACERERRRPPKWCEQATKNECGKSLGPFSLNRFGRTASVENMSLKESRLRGEPGFLPSVLRGKRSSKPKPCSSSMMISGSVCQVERGAGYGPRCRVRAAFFVPRVSETVSFFPAL